MSHMFILLLCFKIPNIKTFSVILETLEFLTVINVVPWLLVLLDLPDSKLAFSFLLKIGVLLETVLQK